MTAADTTALLEKLDKPVKPLEWHSGPEFHETHYANSRVGRWSVWEIDGRGYFRAPWMDGGKHAGASMSEAKAAADTCHEQHIFGDLSLTPSDLASIKAALVEREAVREAIPKVRETLIAINRRGGLGFGVHDNLEACIAALGKDKS